MSYRWERNYFSCAIWMACSTQSFNFQSVFSLTPSVERLGISESQKENLIKQTNLFIISKIPESCWYQRNIYSKFYKKVSGNLEKVNCKYKYFVGKLCVTSTLCSAEQYKVVPWYVGNNVLKNVLPPTWAYRWLQQVPPNRC
jgi:hypothetical protein